MTQAQEDAMKPKTFLFSLAILFLSMLGACDTYNPIPVTGISISPSTMTLAAPGASGAESFLTATITPASATYQNLVWTSSDPAVATVSISGFLQAVGVGTTTITATVVPGDGTGSATCQVTVQ